MSELKGVLPAGTEATINGFQVRFDENLHFTALNVNSYDQAAEQSALGGFPADWSHTETVEREIDGDMVEVTILVQYGPQGDRIVTDVCQNPVVEGSVEIIEPEAEFDEFLNLEADELPQIVAVTEDSIEVIEDGEVTTFVEADVVEEKPKGKGKKTK